MAIFPGAVSTDADLYIAVNTLSALLTDNPLTIGATTVNVNSTTLFPNVGFISIDAEIIKYTGKTATSFTGCTRGADGSTAAAHSLGAQVDHNVVAAHHNANKDEIIATQQFISDHIGLTTNVLAAEFEFLDGVTSNLQTQLNAKATDTLVVHLAGVETLTGTKTLNSFSGTLAANIAAAGFKLTGLGAGTTNGDSLRYEQVVGVYALDSTVVHLAGTETITGLKTFTDTAKINSTVEATLDLTETTNSVVIRLRSSNADAYIGTDTTHPFNVKANNINGVMIATTGAVAIRGTTTNNSAASGFVGEYLESTSNGSAANTAANDVWFDMTSLSLGAGEWEVYLMAHGSRNTATWSRFDAGIGTTTGNSAAGLVIARNYSINEFASSSATPTNVTVMVASYRIQLNSTTTYYAKARANFSSGQPQYVYTMFARRVR